MRNIFVTILPENAHIFNADTEFSGQIDAGLCRTDSACRHGLVISCVGAGAFMDLQTHTMTVAMAEVGAVTGISDDLTGSSIDVAADGAWLWYNAEKPPVSGKGADGSVGT